MNLPSMARITKIPLERLEALGLESPVFAPGVMNYVAMGAIHSLWEGNLADRLNEALEAPVETDQRRLWGEARKGRKLARSVSDRVQHSAR